MIDYSTILVILVIECTFLYFTFSFLNFSIWRFWCIGWFSICCFWILITSLIILLSWLTWTTLFLCTLWWFLIMLLFLTWSFICRCFWCISFIWRCCFFRLFTWFLVNSCIISCFSSALRVITPFSNLASFCLTVSLLSILTVSVSDTSFF